MTTMRFYDPHTCSRIEMEGALVALSQGLVPSVTTILSIIRSPHLEEWLIRRALDYYRRTGDYEGALEYEDTRAADFGTVCHALLESYLTGTPCQEPHDRRHRQALQPLLAWIDRNATEVLFCEACFADVELGYGGTADLLLRLKTGRPLLCDLKTKKHSQRFPMQPDISYKYQLSAYRRYFQKVYGEMHIANLLLASPFGYDATPRLIVCDYGAEDWTTGFTPAHRLWLEQVYDQ
ncbi:MAG: hypothetical protein M3347_06915 [Armatimonadota bacterium]|nr:hypothetical protein [Armatimonadota bacterium]